MTMNYYVTIRNLNYVNYKETWENIYGKIYDKIGRIYMMYIIVSTRSFNNNTIYGSMGVTER